MSDEVYSTIKERILFGIYPPGEIINEKKLSDEFGVSRTPIRENLAKLEWEKLLNIVPRAGAIVSPIEITQIREVFQIRVFVEGLVGLLAGEKITQKHLDELHQLQKDCTQLLDKGTKEDVIKIDIAFRAVLANASGNTTLKEISDLLYNITLRVWFTIIAEGDFQESVRLQLDEMDKVITALKKNTPQRVEKIRREAIANYVKKMKEYF